MERQLASLTGLVQKALNTGGVGGTVSPRPDHLPPPPQTTTVPPTPTLNGCRDSSSTSSTQRQSSDQSRDFLQVPTSGSSRQGSGEFFGFLVLRKEK